MSAPFEGAEGVIERFDAEDSIGVLKLDDGREVKFGATACKGFLPVVGARIRLDEVRAHPRHGVKARLVSLLDAEQAHHERTAKTYGLKRATVEEQRSTAAFLGWITVLLDEPLPETQAQLDELTRRLALAQHGMRFVRDTTGDITIEGGGRSIRAYPVPAPIGEDRLDLDLVGKDFPRGVAHVALSLGMVDVARKLRKINPEIGQRDAGDLGRAARALSELGPGVVLDLADGLVLSRADFARDLDDATPHKPWAAYTTGHDQRYMRTRGMPYLCARDIAMAMLSTGSDETVAVLSALAQDLAGGWQPQPGEAVSFSLGGRELHFQMMELGSGWWLHAGDRDEAYIAHHAGLWLAATERLPMRRSAYLTSENPAAPAHYIDVYTGAGSAMVTNGLSLTPQPGGTPEEGNQRVELMCYLDRHASAHARLLSVFGGMMHSQNGERPLRPWDGLRNGPDSGLPSELELMLLVPREPLLVWPGNTANLLQVVAVSADEYQQLRGNPEAGAAWLEARKQARDWKSYHQRFNALLA